MPEIYERQPDGTLRPATPEPWREEHVWLIRVLFWIRGVGHCGKPGRIEATDD